eukprot:SM000025S08481  [mRNA]  locus=s25:1075652:1076324:- [translate_table: standard]
MKPVISGQPPASMKSSVAYGQRPPNSAPPTVSEPFQDAIPEQMLPCQRQGSEPALSLKLYTFIKEAGEKVLGNWPDSRQQSQEFGKLVLQATRPILHNLVESCKGDIAPSTGIKIGVENFVAATYDASYACGKVYVTYCLKVLVLRCCVLPKATIYC